MERKAVSLLVMAEDSPESYSPAGERIRHLSIAGGSIFDKVSVLTLQGKQAVRVPSHPKSRIYLYTIDFSRGLPFPLSALFDPVKSLMFVAHGLRLRGRVKPFFIVGSMPPVEVGVSAWLLSRLFHARLLVDLRDDWESAVDTQLTRYFPRLLVRVVFQVAKKVYSDSSLMFVVTETIAKTIRDRGIRTNIILVPNGANTSLFRPQGIDVRNKVRLQYNLPRNKVIVVYGGSGVNPYYRLDLVLESVRLLSKGAAEKLHFIFFMSSGRERLDELRRQLRIPDELVEIRDPLPRRRLAEVLSASDVGLVPFDAKSYLLCARSTKIYEYLSSGLYVLSSGPRGGELDSLFSENPRLGSFTLPSASNFANALLRILERARNLLEEDSRGLRYGFVRENYDRQNVMKEALNNALRSVTNEDSESEHQ